MDGLGYILATYVLAFGSVAALAWRVITRGKALAKQLPEEDKPWT